MIMEIRRRPLARPLFVWIAGILFAPFSWAGVLAGILLLIPLFILLFSFRKEEGLNYESRWVWGVLFSCLLFFLSVQVTDHRMTKVNRSHKSSAVVTYATGLQKRCVEKLDRLHLNDEEKGILSTMTVGYRKQLPRTARQQFSATGVAHLLAVSGFHVGIVAGFVSLLFFFTGNSDKERWFRYTFLILTVIVYVVITGCAASSIRAAFMSALYFTGRMLRRPADRYNTLAAAAFCMLVYDPLYLFDVGFQLSFMAVFFIFWLKPRLDRYVTVRNPLIRIPWNWVMISLSAQAGVFLLCLYYFGSLPLVFLWINLPLIALVTILIPAVFIWLICPEWLSLSFLQFFIEWLTGLMMKIVTWFFSFPYASWEINISLYEVIGGYILFFTGMTYRKLKINRIFFRSIQNIRFRFRLLSVGKRLR